MSDLISRQAVLKLLYALPPEEATTKAMLIQSVKQMDSETVTECNNLISRQAAIDAIAELTSSMSVCTSVDECHGMKRMQGMEVRALEGLPSAQPEPHWIPCSERLPEEDTEVLISYRYKEGEGDTDHVNIDITSYGTTCFGGREIHTLKEWRQPFDYFHANYEVIAWMPLPTPYREE